MVLNLSLINHFGTCYLIKQQRHVISRFQQIEYLSMEFEFGNVCIVCHSSLYFIVYFHLVNFVHIIVSKFLGCMRFNPTFFSEKHGNPANRGYII